MPYCDAVLDELYASTLDWTGEDLDAAVARAVALVAAHHPELSHEALPSLEWQYRFDWK